jgi:hypothetical protein
MRVELSSSVTGPDINFREIASASNLDIVGSFKAANAGQVILRLRTKPHSQMCSFKGALW